MTRSIRESCDLNKAVLSSELDEPSSNRPPASMPDLMLQLGLSKLLELRAYDRYYEAYFSKYRKASDFALLQLSYDMGDARDLLLLWAAYFENPSRIHVLLMPNPNVLNPSQDVTSKACAYDPYKCEKVKVFVGDASDSLFLMQDFSLNARERDYDVIVDDWSHHPAHQILAFTWLFRLVKPGGLYVIQNLGPSYWSQAGAEVNGYSLFGSGIGKPADRNAVEKFKQLADVLMLRHQLSADLGDVSAFDASVGDRDVFSVTFGEDVVVIQKSNAFQRQHAPLKNSRFASLVVKSDVERWMRDMLEKQV